MCGSRQPSLYTHHSLTCPKLCSSSARPCAFLRPSKGFDEGGGRPAMILARTHISPKQNTFLPKKMWWYLFLKNRLQLRQRGKEYWIEMKSAAKARKRRLLARSGRGGPIQKVSKKALKAYFERQRYHSNPEVQHELHSTSHTHTHTHTHTHM